MTAQQTLDVTRVQRNAIERELKAALTSWHDEVDVQDIPRARQELRQILVGPLTLTPQDGTYAFEGESVIPALLLGRAGLATFMARPEGLEPYGTNRGNRRSLIRSGSPRWVGEKSRNCTLTPETHERELASGRTVCSRRGRTSDFGGDRR
jgi:hypothetical protein